MEEHLNSIKKNITEISNTLQKDSSLALGEFFVALWPEGDGHSGYIATTDGTMMPIGDYASPVLHLDDFLRDAQKAITAGPKDPSFARHLVSLVAETGNILKTLTPLSDETREEIEDEYLPYCFNDSELVTSALLDRSAHFEDLFNLYHMCPGSRAHEGHLAPRHRAVLAENITVSGIAQSATGELIWQSTDIPKGHAIEGRLGHLGFRMNTSYGHVVLGLSQVEKVVARPHV